MEEPRNPFRRFINSVYCIIDTPVTYIRETVIEPNHKEYPYYHQKFRRVPTIDECYTDDYVCAYEANQQFLRDKQVESEILSIMRQRYEHCIHEDINQRFEQKCEGLHEEYENAAAAWFAKYGDLGPKPNVVDAFMKQKHRMVWERRHGEVGQGVKEKFVIENEDH